MHCFLALEINDWILTDLRSLFQRIAKANIIKQRPMFIYINAELPILSSFPLDFDVTLNLPLEEETAVWERLYSVLLLVVRSIFND